MAVQTVYSDVRDSGEFELLKVLDDKQLTSNGTSDEVEIDSAKSICLYAHGNSPAVNGGVITLEGSPISGYQGTWKSLGTVTLASTAMQAVSVTDGDDGFPTRFVRARISTQIANGNCDAYIAVHR